MSVKPKEEGISRPTVAGLRRYLSSAGLGPLLVRASLGSLILRIAGMGVAFLVGVQLARGLGVEQYGVYSLAMSIVALLSVPAEFGLPQLVTREVAVARTNKNWGHLIGVFRWADRTIGFMSVALALLVVGGLLVGYGTEAKGLAATLMWGVLLVPLVALGKVRGAALRALNHIVKGQLPDLFVRPALFAAVLAIGLMLLEGSIRATTAMSLHVAAAAMAFILAVVLLRRQLPTQAATASPVTHGRAWFGSALPLALTEGLRIAQASGAILVLGLLSTVGDVGLYKVANSVAIMCVMPMSLLNVVVAPLLAQLFAEGNVAKLQRTTSYAAAAMFGGGLLLSLPLFVAGRPILELVFGAEYGDAVLPLLLLCGGQVVSAFSGPNSTLLNMTGHERRVTRAFVASLVINLVVAAASIPSLGVVGAALGSVAGSLVWNGLLWLDSRKIVRVDPSMLAFFSSWPPGR